MNDQTRILIDGSLDDLFRDFSSFSQEDQNCKETTYPPDRYTKKKKSKYLLPGQTPRPKRGLEESRTSYAFRDFYSQLIRHGLRLMGQAKGTLTLQEVEDVLSEYANVAAEKAHLPTVSDYEVATGNADKREGYSERAIELSISKAASIVVADFDLTVYEARQERASAAGKKTKWSLEHFLEVQGMNNSQAARHLGFSRPTVIAMRKHFANIDLSTGEVHE